MNRLDAERRKKSELWAQQKQKSKELEESTARVEKLRDYIETSKKTLSEHKKLKQDLEKQVRFLCDLINDMLNVTFLCYCNVTLPSIFL